ncbi:cysteate synthase (plasmid) [Streptomyces sp. NBC_01340]|uniref:cysteate synthase n=1 Tax=unclassified Streptomyces TaxID=2593676 RepID=UPI002252F514|nr:MULTISPECIES: cysteate synthase [unclassified Streptomyces]MCX4460731.1 cysteate synthase [Streptomyces sp. NBC_01719]MCX4499939.1 cysteate synthase [Streptomyces sp. NBC_01728]WSI45065.1 cysteate synthase [Streptomyces sp. NBC_01340]
MSSNSRHYTLVCPECGSRFADDGLMLSCAGDHSPAFLRTSYDDRDFTVRDDIDGLYRYQSWLPVRRTVPGAGGTVTYRSEGLARALGIGELWIAFNGYWPERGATLNTGTFKELEAYTVLGRLPDDPPILVVPSVGNTAAAFASTCARTGTRCLLIVPESGLHRLAGLPEPNPHVRVVSIAGGTYDHAITLAEQVSALPGFQAVGGAWNVARRDGLATVLLNAVEAMGRLPRIYVQAIGSAVGAIAVHEAAKRLIASGGYGATLPRMMLCQNEEFAPVHELWRIGRGSGTVTERGAAAVYADELVNQRPPYRVTGGIADTLDESGGEILLAGRDRARTAAELFADTEGIDIEPAASVAVACLAQAAAQGRIPNDAGVLLNITGGGRARLAAETRRTSFTPHLRLPVDCLGQADAVARAGELFTARHTPLQRV